MKKIDKIICCVCVVILILIGLLFVTTDSNAAKKEIAATVINIYKIKLPHKHYPQYFYTLCLDGQVYWYSNNTHEGYLSIKLDDNGKPIKCRDSNIATKGDK